MSAIMFNNNYIKKHTTYVYCDPINIDISAANRKIYMSAIGNEIDKYISKLENTKIQLKNNISKETRIKLLFRQAKYMKKLLAILSNNGKEIIKQRCEYDYIEESECYIIEKDDKYFYLLPISYICDIYESLKYAYAEYENPDTDLEKKMFKKIKRCLQLSKEVNQIFGIKI